MSVPDLSLTEQRIVSLIAAGRSTSEIATSVGLDERTVEWHLARARRKLERAAALHDRIQQVGSPRLDTTGGSQGDVDHMQT